MKTAVALLALVLIIGACASDPDEETTDAGQGSNEESSEPDESSEANESSEASTDAGDDPAADGGESGDDGGMGDDPADDASSDDEAMEDDPADEASSDDGAMEDDSGSANPVAGLFISGVLGQAGVEPTDEIVACVERRGIDLDLAPTASEDAVAEATLAVFGCAPDELGQVLAADTEAPPGTDRDDVACVIGETFRYLSELPTDVALEALEADTPPQEIRDDLGPIAEQNCGLDADQVDAIFDS